MSRDSHEWMMDQITNSPRDDPRFWYLRGYLTVTNQVGFTWFNWWRERNVDQACRDYFIAGVRDAEGDLNTTIEEQYKIFRAKQL